MLKLRTTDNVLLKVERVTYPSQVSGQPHPVCVVKIVEVNRNFSERPYYAALSNAKPGMVLTVPAAALMPS